MAAHFDRLPVSSAAAAPVRRRARDWLRDLSIDAKLRAIVVAYVAVIALLLAVVALAFVIATGIRAYVGGEGLWSKGQKDAVYYLTRYARTLDERHYQSYLQAVARPLGDRAARLEMEKPDYDYAVVERGFVAGGNAAHDVPYLLFLFRHFRGFPHFREAVAIWTEADRHIAELVETAEELHREILGGGLDLERQRELLERIEAINARVTPLEEAFSSTLAEGARWVGALLLQLILVTAALLLSGGLFVTFRIGRALRASIVALQDGARRVARGELDAPVPVRSADELGQLAVAFNDMVAHRREAAATIEREREFLQAVLDNIADGVAACDPQGRLTLFNSAMRRMYDLPRGPLAPEQWAEHFSLYRADGRTPLPADEVPLLRALRGEEVHDVEIVVVPRDGAMRTLLCSGQPIGGASAASLGAVVTTHDITARKRAEQELAAHAAELARSNAELEQFAYVASHDLQEPLRTLTSYTQLLVRRYRDAGGDAAEFAGYITDAAQRMRDLIDGLLAYSRVARDSERFERTGLGPLLSLAVANLGGAIAASGAQITQEALPEVYVNRPLMAQVFQNLVGNALKFRGEAPPSVHVGAERVGEEWHIRVRDNGIGIDPRHAERIFALFQRLHTRDQYPGSGIGLAICRRIIERHGGRIWVEPATPGSVFRFTLPASDPA